MSRWIVTNVPSWLLLAGLVIGITAAAMTVHAYVRRRFPRLAEGEHNDIAKTGFGVVGPVYGFMIGFIVASLWGQVGAADQVVRTEGASAAQMARELHVFAKADGDRLREGLLSYERAALAEWPEAANGRAAPEAEKALADLHSAYDNIQPTDDKQRNALTSSRASLKQLGLSRTERLVMARTNIGPPLSLWAVILLTSVLVLGFAVIIGEKQVRMHRAMVAAVSVLVAVLLFLVTELAFPFHGEMGTSPEPLRAASEVLQAH
jgi:Protein of unknown function (DUF4239)